MVESRQRSLTEGSLADLEDRGRRRCPFPESWRFFAESLAHWEPEVTDRCIWSVGAGARFHCAGIAAALLIIPVGGCASPQIAGVRASPSVPIHTFPGGCAGTQLTDAEPPVWAQGGFRTEGAPWPVPWAFGTQKTTVAFLSQG